MHTHTQLTQLTKEITHHHLTKVTVSRWVYQVTTGIQIYGETGKPKQDNEFSSVCYVTTLSINS